MLRVGIDYIPPPPARTEFRLYTPESFDLFLAEKIAGQMNRKLELVQTGDDATADLAAGRVDIALQRRPVRQADAAGIVSVATGFASGLTTAMRSDSEIRHWADLDGRKVCISRGNRAAEALARQHGAIVQIEDAPARSLVLVRTGVCDAAIHDEILLDKLSLERGWKKFSRQLAVSPALELAALVNARDRELGKAVDRVFADTASDQPDWNELVDRWARNVAFEVYLDQDAPDCH